jgi:hypothetical protein
LTLRLSERARRLGGATLRGEGRDEKKKHAAANTEREATKAKLSRLPVFGGKGRLGRFFGGNGRQAGRQEHAVADQ